MQLKDTQDIYHFLRMYISSVALNTSLEIGLFWQLADKPLGVDNIAQKFDIPPHRCLTLLELITELGLLEKHNDKFITSTRARKAILEAYSHKTWAFIAKIAQDRLPLFNDLTSNITHPESIWSVHGNKPPNWFFQIKNNPEYADTFTQGLFEFHSSFAKRFAHTFDISGVDRIMDVGGGSGVVSLELLKRHMHLTAVVIDVENVCKTGRKIADGTQVANRIEYKNLDHDKDDLPEGFDLVIQCDAGNFTEEFFKKMRKSLNENGRFVIITNIDGDSDFLYYPECKISLYRRMNAFSTSLDVSRFKQNPFTVDKVKDLLLRSEYSDVIHEIWDNGTVVIQAHK
ncbi:MAG: class I SAM-dependent methyltransferase [Candidatus Hodarchaeales archaeon]|jgi:hypothetical protein